MVFLDHGQSKKHARFTYFTVHIHQYYFITELISLQSVPF